MVATTLIWQVKVDRRTQSVFFPASYCQKAEYLGSVVCNYLKLYAKQSYTKQNKDR